MSTQVDTVSGVDGRTEPSSESSNLSHSYHACTAEMLVARCGYRRTRPLSILPTRQPCVICEDLHRKRICPVCGAG